MAPFQLFYLSILLLFNNVFTKDPSVIIVGAGSAGIAAAARLLENSITNIKILEAENRIGGRIQTVKLGDGFVDVGAEYCRGEEGNSVYELVKDLDLLEHVRNFSADTARVYYSNSSAIAQDLALDLKNVFFTYETDLGNCTDDVSIGQAFWERYSSTTLKKYANDKDKLNVATEALKMLQDNIILIEGAFSWFQPSAKRHFVTSPGDQAMTWRIQGFQLILDVLMKKYPDPSKKLPIDDKIFLNKKVKRILWSCNKATVKTSDNSSFKADHVIFTPSVGVLHHQHNTLFRPQLPPQKKKALEAIGHDGVMKLILHFPKKWWKDDQVYFFVWKKEDLLNIKNEFSEGPSKNGIPWVSEISFVSNVPNNPNVLIAWGSGDIMLEVERTPKDVLIRGCMYLFKKFLNKDYNVSNADDVIGSQWNNNNNFRGTYSYGKTGYYKKDVSYNAQLAEPLVNYKGKPLVLFAGEGTNPTLYASVHGAIDTGIREADRIINLYKHDNPFVFQK